MHRSNPRSALCVRRLTLLRIPCGTAAPGRSKVLVLMGGVRGKLAAAAALAVVATAAPASAATFKEYSLGTAPAHQPRYIKAGPDGNIWFADGGTQGGIGRISPTGELFAEFGGLGPVEIAFAADGTAY